MEKNSRSVFLWALIFVASLLSACGGGSSSSSSSTTYGQLRLINSTGASLSMTALSTSATTGTTATTVISSLASAAASSYYSLKTDTYTVDVATTDGSLVSYTRSVTLSASTNYTTIAYKRKGAIGTFTFTDNQSTPSSGYASLRIANASQDAGSLDVYVVSPGTTSLTDLSPTFSGTAYSSTSAEQAIAAGTYDIIVTGNGNRSSVRLTLSSVTLSSGGIITLALTGTTGGTLVDGALITQGGSVQFAPTTSARVRVVAAFPANGNVNSSVATTVGSTALKTLASPSLGTYTLIPGGVSSYSVSVDGTAVTGLPTATFANGGDYTLLVYGSATTPLVAAITDDNRLPDTGANMRLVNAAVSNSGLTLIDNYATVNDDVQYGVASSYAPVSASSSLIQVTSPYAGFPSYSSSGISIVSGGVYTMFVLGTAATPIEVLSKDR